MTHPDTLCASIRLALKPSGILHHFEPSYIDDLGVEKLDLQVREGYRACGIELQVHPPIRINQSDYLHWSRHFAISQ